jgi:hypothetical protein
MYHWLCLVLLIASSDATDTYLTRPRCRDRAALAGLGLVATVATVTLLNKEEPCTCTAPDGAHLYPEMAPGTTRTVGCAPGYAPAYYRREVNGTVVAGWPRDASVTCDLNCAVSVEAPCAPAMHCTAPLPTAYVRTVQPGTSLHTSNFSCPVTCGPLYEAANARAGEPPYPYALPCGEPGGEVTAVGCVPAPLPDFG